MTRIVIMARNEVGVIADISRALADADINIETISAKALGDKGIITLTTDDDDSALRVLTDADFKAAADDSLMLSLRDEPGALARVAERRRPISTGRGSRRLELTFRPCTSSTDARAIPPSPFPPTTARRPSRWSTPAASSSRGFRA